MKQQKYIEGNFGTKPQKVVKNGQHSKTGQAVKFYSYEKFATLQNLCNAHSPSVFSSNCLLLCSCSFEFNSGSLHLNWLEDNGVIGLQNYKTYPQNMISSIVGTLVCQLGYLS